MERLKIGVLVDTEDGASKYLLEFVRWAQASTDIEVTCLITQFDTTEDKRKNRATDKLRTLHRLIRNRGFLGATEHILARVLWRAILGFEAVLLKRHGRYRGHLERFGLRHLVPHVISVTPLLSKSGYVHRFDAEDLARLAGLDLDIILRAGSGILKGDILNVARLGVISFHHADNRLNRGGPAGFWEVYNEDDTTGFTIQKLSEELDGGDVIMRGAVQTQYFYLLNEAALYEKSNRYLKLVMMSIAQSRSLSEPLPSYPYSNRLFRAPSAGQCLLYIARLAKRIGSTNVRKLAGFEYSWNVGFVRNNWRKAVLWRGSFFRKQDRYFVADPFVYSRDGADFCFVEEFDRDVDRAHISVYELGDRSSQRLGRAVVEPFHLSFPYLFEHAGDLYMCPECSESRQIRLYKCVEFPLKWQLERILIDGISAVDTVIFPKCGRWWLLTSTDPDLTGDFFELSIFSSNSPISNSWTPHKSNPIIVDAGCARNGGLLQEGDRIFRIAQRQGFNLYGRSAEIREITEINDEVYRERVCSTLVPQFIPGAIASHHLDSKNELTVYDYLSLHKRRARHGTYTAKHTAATQLGRPRI